MSFGPISSTPISSLFGGGGGSSPPPTAVVSVSIPTNSIKYRWREPYVSDATNTKFLGVPRGVYVGFVPSMAGGVLSLAPDPDYGVSLLRVNSQTSLTSVDVCSPLTLTLDFNGHAVFPVYVLARVFSNIGGPTSAEVFTSIGPPSGGDEVLICKVNSLTSVDFDAPTNRDTPFAYAGAPLGFGFMQDGAVEQLIAAVAAVTEVQNARVDLTGTTQVDLATRLAVDGAPAAVAGRLAQTVRAIQSLDYTTAGAVTSIQVGSSFSALYRTTPPIETFNGFGSETVPGVVTGGSVPTGAPIGSASDPVRNICTVINTVTGQRLMDGTTPAYGRLTLDQIQLQGSVSFNAGLPTVNGFATAFLSEVDPGDLICDSFGNCYEVLSVPSNVLINLSSNALLSDTTTSTRKRYTLSFLKSDGNGGEVDVTVAAATSLRFFCQVWRTVETALFDRMPILHQYGEPTPVPVATTTVAGRARLAVSGNLAGALNAVQDNGTPVGSGNFNTLNFEGCADGGAGVLTVTQRGPTGAQGPAAPSGPTGPTGPAGATGPGLNFWNYHESGSYDHFALGPGVIYDYDVSVGYEILFLTGGMKRWEGSFVTDANDYFDIQNIARLTTTTARLTARVPNGFSPTGIFRYYMITAGQ